MPSGEIDLLSLFGVLWRGRWAIIGITGTVAILIIAYAVISMKLPPDQSPLPNVYEPQALILIHGPTGLGSLSSVLSSSGLSGLGSLASSNGVTTGGGYGDLAVKLLQSPTILDPVASQMHIAKRYHITAAIQDNSRRVLLSHSDFSFDPQTNTVSIGYRDYDAKFATRVVNSFVDILSAKFAKIGGTLDLAQEKLLEQKVLDVKAEITKLSDELETFQKEHGVLSASALITEQTTAIAQLRAALISKQIQIQTYSQFARIKDPELTQLRAERANLEKVLSQMQSGSPAVADAGGSQNDIPRLAMQFDAIKRNLDVQTKLYELLLQQYELAKLAARQQEPIFQVLELATVPQLKAGPHRSRLIIVTVFVGFLVSVIFVMTRNSVRNIRHNPERLRRFRGETP